MADPAKGVEDERAGDGKYSWMCAVGKNGHGTGQLALVIAVGNRPILKPIVPALLTARRLSRLSPQLHFHPLLIFTLLASLTRAPICMNH